MFVIELVYKVPLQEIDAQMKSHMVFLNKYYKSGNFICSGRKVPRNGGIIVAQAKDKKAMEKIMKQDPFYKNQLADFTITEFLASQKIPLLKEIII